MLDRLINTLAPFAGELPTDELARRRPEAIAAAAPLIQSLLQTWYAPEISGFENIPEGPTLVVGTHNGGLMAPDMYTLMTGYWQHFGPAYPSYGLAHDQVMKLPGAGRVMSMLGAVGASPQNAETLLNRGATVLVYPGGDLDAFKPYVDRHIVKFGRRTGFVKIALRTGAPIVPVVSVGAHETFMVLSDGQKFARWAGLKKLFRMDVFPLFLALPFGVGIGPIESHIPMPSKIRLRLLPPIRFDHPPSAADDDSLVRALVEEVRVRMQAGVDELVSEGGFGVVERFKSFISG